jgi:two-component system sensor histidine kinase/response regulator
MLTEAVEAGSPFRVAIIDSDMPGMSGIELGQTIRSRADIGQTVLMIMATMDAQFNPAKLRELGFDGCMTKPVRQSQLFDAIMSAIANAAAMPQLLQVRSTAEGSSGAGRMRPVKRQDARILLAEDNEVNQIVAAEILAKAGYRYDIVADGRKAVEAVFAEHYDLVVMDCQMPELDGFEATHVIRERETIRPRGKGLSARIPIIALTANAIKGDRERCLAAGMDAYISKPVDPAKLIEAIDSLISGPGGVNSRQEDQTMMNRKQNVLSTPPAPAASRPNDPPPFDLNKLLGRCMNSVQTVELILKKFQEQAVQDIQTLTASVSSKDKERTSRTAHGLKGAAGILSATPLTELAAELERMGREDDLDQAEAFLARLEAEVERCLRHLPVAREALAQKSSGRSA